MRLFLKLILLIVAGTMLIVSVASAQETGKETVQENAEVAAQETAEEAAQELRQKMAAEMAEKAAQETGEKNETETAQETGQKAVQQEAAKTPSMQVESTNGGLTVTWSLAPGADHYKLFREEENGKLMTIALIGPEDLAEPATLPMPAVKGPVQAVTDASGQITGYSYTDSLILPGKTYHYYIQLCQEKTGTWSMYDKKGAEATWDVTIPQIKAGTRLTEAAVKQLGEDSFFYTEEISEETFKRMYGKSYKDNAIELVPVENLRYIRCLHRNIDGDIIVGELVMAATVADSVCTIFRELYNQSYPIESMLLVDEFDASDELSIMHNNTSAFNFRTVDNTTELSNHAFGLAIDINPYYNVYYIPSENYIFPPEGWEYLNREADFPYKLTEGDLCFNLFLQAGFSWGGWFTYNIDYQHFYYNAGN